MQLRRVTDDVHVVTGTNVNWALVVEGDAVTVVDAGYPNDAASVVRSLAAIGRRPEDVAAIVLTHAHLDHMGGIPSLASRSGAPVLTGAEEARHARREYLQQISPLEMLGQCRSRRGLTWVGQTLRAVLPHARMSLHDVTAVPADVPLDVPGRLVPLATPGHTSGHTAYLLPGAGILFSGDALVTGHPLSRLPAGPQLLPRVFNEDGQQTVAALDRLRTLPADTLVPGHGPWLRGPLRELVDRALEPPRR
jgi:glyoxylase-like metal-dependent hydrolase (beta-lactamase superfamily II)